MLANLPLTTRIFSLLVFTFCSLSVSLKAYAQATQTLGSLDVDRLGAAVYTLPIAAPNGVGGVKPNITALYNSQAANGLLGKGGSIGGLSVIKRCPQTLVRDGINKAISWSAEDRFCIDTQRLMLIAGTQGAAESQYKTEIDSGVVYTAKGGTSGNPDYFEATAEDGARLVFGGAATAKEQGAATMTWALSQYKDVANNAIEYTYEGTAADGLRIKRINYAFPVPGTTSNPGAYIEFIYKDRDDPISKYVAGYEFRTNKLLTQINSYSLLGLLHRSYQFDLATSSGLAGYVTRWQSVKECTTLIQCFDATRFEWGTTQLNSGGKVETKNIEIGMLAKVPKSSALPNFRVSNSYDAILNAVDLNGNGINDFVWTELSDSNLRSIFTSIDVGVLPFDSPKINQTAIVFNDLADRSVPRPEFGDTTADGSMDVLLPAYFQSGKTSWVVESVGRRWPNFWSRTQDFHPLTTNHAEFSKFADLNGDGYEDAISFSWGVGYYGNDISVNFYKFRKNRNMATPSNSHFTVFDIVPIDFDDIKAKPRNEAVQFATSDGAPTQDDFAKGDFNGDGNA